MTETKHVQMGSVPGGSPPVMRATVTPHHTHTSILDPFTGLNYPKDAHTLTIALIIIAIITFFIMLAINIFFVYWPIARMEEKFDATVQKIDDVDSIVKAAADDVEKVVEDVCELGKIAVKEFDKVKGGLCLWLRAEGINPPFCSESNVADSVTGSSLGSNFGSNSRDNFNRRNLMRQDCKF